MPRRTASTRRSSAASSCATRTARSASSGSTAGPCATSRSPSRTAARRASVVVEDGGGAPRRACGRARRARRRPAPGRPAARRGRPRRLRPRRRTARGSRRARASSTPTSPTAATRGPRSGSRDERAGRGRVRRPALERRRRADDARARRRDGRARRRERDQPRRRRLDDARPPRPPAEPALLHAGPAGTRVAAGRERARLRAARGSPRNARARRLARPPARRRHRLRRGLRRRRRRARAAAGAASFEGMPWILASGLDVEGWEEAAAERDLRGRQRSAARPAATAAADVVHASTATRSRSARSRRRGWRARRRPTGSSARTSRRSAQVAGWQRGRRRSSSWSDADDGELLRYAAATPVGEWEVTAFLDGDALSSPLLGTTITATFAADGTLSGSAGCNNYRGDVHRPTGARSRSSEPAATEKFCAEPAGVMEQEAAYLAALPTAARYQVDGELARAAERLDGIRRIVDPEQRRADARSERGPGSSERRSSRPAACRRPSGSQRWSPRRTSATATNDDGRDLAGLPRARARAARPLRHLRRRDERRASTPSATRSVEFTIMSVVQAVRVRARLRGARRRRRRGGGSA